MFEISWSEILVVGVVALIVVGPKELPTLLRTVGKYMGMVKRQAAEFRAQFDEAMRETELDQLRKEVESIRNEAVTSIRDAERSVHSEMMDAKREFDVSSHITGTSSPSIAQDSPPPPAVPSGPGSAAMAAAAAAEAAPAPHTPEAAPAEPAREPSHERTGA